MITLKIIITKWLNVLKILFRNKEQIYLAKQYFFIQGKIKKLSS